MYRILRRAQAFCWTVDDGVGRVKHRLFLKRAPQQFQIIRDLAVDHL